MKLIDKDALVAEIENLENIYKKCPTRNSYEEGLKDGRLIGYKDALHKINTLEVKEDIEHYELEEFAKIIRGNLTGINKTVQTLFEAKYQQLTGNKMYGGYKD